MEELLNREYVYRGRVLNLRLDTVRLPGHDGAGRETIREVVEHRGAVVIAAVDAQGRVLLVRQYRQAVGRNMLELPAGTLEQDESPEEAAPRELREETGFTAGRWEPLASFFSSPGILTEEMHVYLARDLAEGSGEPEEDEELEVERMPLREALEGIERGEIIDAKTIVGLLLTEKKLNEKATP